MVPPACLWQNCNPIGLTCFVFSSELFISIVFCVFFFICLSLSSGACRRCCRAGRAADARERERERERGRKSSLIRSTHPLHPLSFLSFSFSLFYPLFLLSFFHSARPALLHARSIPHSVLCGSDGLDEFLPGSLSLSLRLSFLFFLFFYFHPKTTWCVSLIPFRPSPSDVGIIRPQ